MLGFRALLDVIPLDASLVKGSHGRPTVRDKDGPLFMTSDPELVPMDRIEATEVKGIILRHVFD